MTYDVIIIGAGIAGCSIARELSKYDISIAVLEKEIEPAFGVSKSNSGIIHPGTQNPPDSLKGKLCVRGNALIRKIAGELELDLKQTGALIAAFDDAGTEKLRGIKGDAEKLGVPRLKIVKKNWLKKHEPNLSENVISALFAPTAGIISPYRFVYALAENAVKNGVQMYFEKEVTGIEKSGPEGVFLVRCGQISFQGKYLVNAAGLNADEISAMAGASKFRITPRKGQEFLLDKKKRNITNHIIFPLPSESSKGVLVIRTSDGNPMIGPTAEETDDKADLTTTETGLFEVLREARKLVPSIAPDDIIAYFAGLRPVCGKDFIIRHEDAACGFINVAGIQSPGLTAAPAIAEMVAGILSENGLILKRKKHFCPDRKEPLHLFDMKPSDIKRTVEKDKRYGDIVCRCETVSNKEIIDAVKRGARTLDGIKFRTRAQAGRCHGSFCTARILRILSEELGINPTEVTKRGKGSGIIKKER